VLRDSTEIQQTRRAVMRQLAYYGEVYYLMRYDFDHGLPPHRDVGFPPLLQLSARGVTFYNALLDDTMKIRSTPMVQFTLPYPSPADTVFVAGNADYRVKVVSKSQKLILRPSNAVMTCYVYEVTRNALPSAPPQYTFYVAPGSAILRIDTQIDQDHIQFSTYNWFVQ
jgi:hypothetical protein